MKNMTFRDIEKIEPNGIEDNDSPLQRWYNEIREKNISEFSISDLCKAVRQNVHIKYVMSEVVTQLEENILVGDMYDGELIAALKDIPEIEWGNIPAEKAKIIEILMHTQNIVDSELKEDIDSLLQTIPSVRE